MPTLNIGGQRVTVGEEFLSLSPERQQATVDEISQSLKGKSKAASARAEISAMLPDAKLPDAASRAQAEYDALPTWGKPLVAADDLANLVVNGVTFGFADNLAAKGDELLGRGSYDEMLKKRTAQTEASRSRAGIPGMIAEIGASVAPVAKMYQAGITATKPLGKYAGAAVDGAIFGGVNAVGNDQPFMQGAGIGAVLGPLGQAVGDVAAPILRPVTSRLFPEKATSRVLQNAMDEAKVTPDQIADDLARAKADGQDVYSVADAMGYPGQRLASTVARTPSEGRAPMVEFLDKRQAGQGGRLTNAIAEGFDAPMTAAQKTKSLTDARRIAGNVDYSAARAAASDVDVMPAVQEIKKILGTPKPKPEGLAPDSIEASLAGVRNRLFKPGEPGKPIATKPKPALKSWKNNPFTTTTAATPPTAPKLVRGFDQVLRIKQDVDDAIDSAIRSGNNNKARLLSSVRDKLDDALEKSSAPYAKARDQYRRASMVIDAVETGKTAAMRGRSEDNIRDFMKMGFRPSGQAEQQAYRTGYSDPLIEKIQGAAVGANKARPLINDATEMEFPAIAAPGKGPQLGARIRREQTMFETRQAALGGSKTADNMADEAALSIIDPSIVGNLLSGNLTGAAKNAVLQAVSALKGQPPRVRQLLSEALRETNPNIARQKLNAAMKQIKASQQQKDAIIRTLMLIGTSGAVQAQN